MRRILHKDPVIGQECVCPDGLGRVTHIDKQGLIRVKTYVRNRSCCWDRSNVRLIRIQYEDEYLTRREGGF